MKPSCFFVFSCLIFNWFYFGGFTQIVNLSGEDSTIFISHTIFLPKYAVPSGKENWSLAISDIDNDGDLDLIGVSQLDNNINVHLNDGRGNFSAKKSYVTGLNPRAVTTGDFNKDGKIDIATVSIKDGNLNWHLQQPDGGFYAKKTVYTGVFPHWIETADINNDGNLDLITVTNADNNINIHLNDGSSNFVKPIIIKTGEKPRVVKLADLNKDNKLDLVTGSDGNAVNVHLSSANSPQAYQPKISLASGEAIWGLGITDLNKDGRLDIVAVSYFNGKICTHLNAGYNRFEPVRFENSGEFNFDLVLGDFDADGDVDAVTASTRDGCLNVHLNDGKGILGPKNCIKSGDWNSRVVAGDVDGDKDLDIISASIKDNNLNVHRNISLDPEKPIDRFPFYGTIFDKNTHKHLVGVITLETPEGTTIAGSRTDDAGNFKFFIPKSSIVIKLRVSEYPFYTETFIFPDSVSKEGIRKNIYLEKVLGTFVYGKVIDTKTRQPIPSATLYLRDFKKQLIDSLTTNETGDFKKELPFASNYKLTATANSYNEKTAMFSLTTAHFPKGLEVNIELIKIEPKIIVCVEGIVKDEVTGIPLAAAVIRVQDSNGNIVKETTSDIKGYYKLCVPFGPYLVATSRKDYLFETDSLILTKDQVYQTIQHDILLKKIEINKAIILKNIFFDVNEATLRPESIQELERLLAILQENPTIKIEISGHTDSDGSDEFNMRLSQARAQTVVEYLIDAKIPAERLTAKGYGETKPIAANDTPENKQKNRRTEFQIISN